MSAQNGNEWRQTQNLQAMGALGNQYLSNYPHVPTTAPELLAAAEKRIDELKKMIDTGLAAQAEMVTLKAMVDAARSLEKAPSPDKADK